MKDQFVLFGVLILFMKSSGSEGNCFGCTGKLKLETDGPAIFDAPISIKATIENAHEFEGPFYFNFNDDVSPMHFNELESDDGVKTYTISYPHKEYQIEGNVLEVEMTIRVYVPFLFVTRKKIASGTITYQITKSLNGKIDVSQTNRTINFDDNKSAIVSTQNSTKFNVDLLDPHDFLSNANISYFWFINGTNYGSTNGSSFEYQLKSPSISQIEAFVYAYIPNKMSKLHGLEIEGNRSYDFFKNYPARNDQLTASSSMIYNRFSTHVNARTPMTYIKHTGDVWLKDGESLNLWVTCDGSGPWTYCWYFPRNNTASHNITCEDWLLFDHQDTISGNCRFNVYRYFPVNGAYSAIIIVSDGLTQITKQVGINVYTGPSRVSISFILIPIISSMLAIAAFISALFVFFNYKQNMRGRETANFDFISSQDEAMEYKTFWERIRDDMLQVLGRQSCSESEVLVGNSEQRQDYLSTVANTHEVIT